MYRAYGGWRVEDGVRSRRRWWWWGGGGGGGEGVFLSLIDNLLSPLSSSFRFQPTLGVRTPSWIPRLPPLLLKGASFSATPDASCSSPTPAYDLYLK
jgi:hypothetical protein